MNLNIWRKPWFAFVVIGVASVFTFQNCSPSYEIKDSVTNITQSQLVSPTNNPDPQDTVCDPAVIAANATNGLVAELFYVGAHQAGNLAQVESYLDPALATKSSKQLYFSQVNTPPQIFTSGFKTQTGDLVRDDSNQVLTTNFALRYYSELMVTRTEDEGTYEFSSLSDDGMILDAFIDDDWRTIINNDGIHFPLMKCSSKTITLYKDKPVSLRLYYFQAQAHILSNVLHWRKLATPASPLGTDIACNKGGIGNEEYFFNPKDSTPKATYTSFLQRNWTVVPAKAFYLPNSLINPCDSK